MSPNSPALCGDNAPLEFFKIAYNQIGLRNGTFTTIDVFGDGREYVTETGFWQSFDADNKLFDNGNYLVLWNPGASYVSVKPKSWPPHAMHSGEDFFHVIAFKN